MDMFLDFPNIVQEMRGCMVPGRLKLQDTKVIFKNMKNGEIKQFEGSDVECAHWLIRARGYCLKLSLKSGEIHRFDGMKEMDFDKLEQFIERNYSVTLEKKDVSTKGWNWGTANFIGNGLDFVVSDKMAFDIPLKNVCRVTKGKNEVTLEFHLNEEAPVSMMEMRFHVPSDNTAEGDQVEQFYEQVVSKADIIQDSIDAFAVFSEVHCLTPRGRYEIKMFASHLHLHGKTFDYKIRYTTVLRLFLLPHRDGRQMYFVIGLDPPIIQGQTRYRFLILLFNLDEEMSLELNISSDDLKEKYNDKLDKEVNGAEFEVISKVMKVLIGRKITVPGTFSGKGGSQSISCSYKASTGFLYPLEKSFIFVYKPSVHIRFEDVSCVNFGRSSQTTRTFDFDVEATDGETYNFSSIEKDEYAGLYDFVKKKKLTMQNHSITNENRYKVDMASSDEDGDDAYMRQMKNEGKNRHDDDLDSDDESDDEDFNPDGSGSSVAEEYDTDAGSSASSGSEYSNSGSGSDKEKREKVVKEKKRKSAKTVPEPGMKKTKRKKKSGKDPNLPKRAMSGYMLWLCQERSVIKAENPSASVTDVSKIAGERWKELSAEEKEEWKETASKDKLRYEEEMKEYRKNAPSGNFASPKNKKSKSTPTKDPKGGSGSGFKSKEYISESESSNEGSNASAGSEKSDVGSDSD